MANTTYASIAELKERVSVDAGDASSDVLLQQVLNSAARLVDRHTRGAREGYEAFSASAEETRYFDDEGTGFVSIDDAISVSSVGKGGEALDAAAWKVLPYQGLPIMAILLGREATAASGDWYGYPLWGIGVGTIAVTGVWGYCTQANRPAVVKEATLTQAALMVQHIGRPEAAGQAHELHGMAAAALGSIVRRVWVL